MELVYKDSNVEKQCTSLKEARKLFGGNDILARSFAIDVKNRKEPWRIIIRPLDKNKEPYVPCNIDEIAGIVQIVGIMGVSKHYE